MPDDGFEVGRSNSHPNRLSAALSSFLNVCMGALLKVLEGKLLRALINSYIATGQDRSRTPVKLHPASGVMSSDFAHLDRTIYANQG